MFEEKNGGSKGTVESQKYGYRYFRRGHHWHYVVQLKDGSDNLIHRVHDRYNHLKEPYIC